MSHRRDRRTPRPRPSGRPRAPRSRTTSRRGQRTGPGLRRQSRGLRWGIIAAGAVATIVLTGAVLVAVRAILLPEPTPTVVSASLSPSPPLASPWPTTVEPGVSPEASNTPPPLETPSVSATAPPAVIPSESVTPLPLDLPALQQFMLGLINEDRSEADLTPVTWDPAAALAAQSHADEMARYGYMSHWNLDGYGPPHRYSKVGGLDAVQENVYMYWHRYDDGRPAPIENWEDVIRQAEVSLMSSPGHRENILAPEHTHVGIGMAYNPESGDLRLAQLFVNRYTRLQALPKQAALGQQIRLQGRLETSASQPLYSLAYEPFPQPMGIEDLNATGPYTSQAEDIETANLEVDENGRFSHDVTLEHKGRPGIYLLRVWVDTLYGQVLANEIAIEVH